MRLAFDTVVESLIRMPATHSCLGLSPGSASDSAFLLISILEAAGDVSNTWDLVSQVGSQTEFQAPDITTASAAVSIGERSQQM